MSMQELIKTESIPAKLSVNFEELKAALAKELERYDVVVTADTLPDAKKLATELNAGKKAIDERRKQDLAVATGPAKTYDGQMKELMQMFNDGRQKLIDQITKFEDETRKTVNRLLVDLRTSLWEKGGVDLEFRRAKYEDLVIISNLTGKGKLTAKAKTAVEARVNEDKSRQERTKMRLLELENQSYRAGLIAPLTRDHVNNFLFETDEIYQIELDRILAAEIDRQEMAEEQMRERMDRENKRAAQKQTETPAVNTEEEPKEPEQKPAPRDDGKITYNVICRFEVAVSPKIKPDAIEKELRRVMEKAGIKSLKEITIKAP